MKTISIPILPLALALASTTTIVTATRLPYLTKNNYDWDGFCNKSYHTDEKFICFHIPSDIQAVGVSVVATGFSSDDGHYFAVIPIQANLDSGFSLSTDKQRIVFSQDPTDSDCILYFISDNGSSYPDPSTHIPKKCKGDTQIVELA
ncbi:uncharacterized protein UTRI_10273 [Ustilago trichophora]|uniref:Mig1 protein n=1 Tax=Ustilago trichophora TaxID=86804 RepID=A0A5C3EER1_9BASI|nr:uncharacterized protein UTRI_10273 [Ustilago trichophora]